MYVCIYGNRIYLLLQWWLQVLTCNIILDYWPQWQFEEGGNEMLEINPLTPGYCFKSANNKRNGCTCLKQTVTYMSRLVYCYSVHWPADTWKVWSWEVTCYVNEAHSGKCLKNKMIKIRTKYTFQQVLNYHLIIYCRVTEKLNSPYSCHILISV